MRISGGVLAGRRINCPPGHIRPAMDRMRESIFAVLQVCGDLDGGLAEKSFLDLFSGSGIIALEAASRGAAFVEAVESDPQKRGCLIKNVSISPVRVQCRFMPVELYIARAKTGKAFDIVFCDPPFPYAYKSDLLRSIASSSLAHSGTLILIHHPRGEALNTDGAPLELLDERIYGRSSVCFFRRSAIR